MSEIDHELCRYLLRDQAVRAAEDAAAVPSIQHRDLPEVVAALTERVARLEAAVIPKSVSGSIDESLENKGDTMPAEGLRTERVTLEVTHAHEISAECWDWSRDLAPGESVRVVEEPAEIALRTERVTPPWQRAKWDEALAIICDGGDWGRGNNFDHGVLGALVIWADKEMDRLAAERDAALRERDAARARVVELEAAAPPRGWLTAEERDLIAGLTDDDVVTEEGQNIAKALLARSSPPKVKVPSELMLCEARGVRIVYDAGKVKRAIRDAGGEVE